MGSTGDEIDRQVKKARDRTDENLGELEERATSGAMRYARIAAITLGVAALAGAGFLVYRHMRRPSRTEQLQRTLVELLNHLPESVRDVPHEVASRLKNPFPSVKVIVNGRDAAREPGTLESIVRRVAPAVVGTASTAVRDRLTRTAEDERLRTTSPDYS